MKTRSGLFFACFFGLFIAANAQPGAQDPGFGAGGVLVQNQSQSFEDCYTSLVQTDGKIILAGAYLINIQTVRGNAVVQINYR